MTDAWSRIPIPGKEKYDEPLLDFDDANVTFDGGDGDEWTSIAKPTT